MSPLSREPKLGRALLCATTSYPQRPHDSAGRFVAQLNAEYAQAGWRPHIICPQRGAQRALCCPLYGFPLLEAPVFGGALRGAGAPDWIQRYPKRALLSAPLSALSLAYHSRRLASTERAAPRVAHWLIPSAFSFQSVTFAHAHGGDVALLEALPYAERWARAIERRVEAINFVSEDLKRRFEALLGHELSRPCTVIPMGVEEPRPDLESALKWRELAGERLLICTVGRLTEIKGHLSLLRAIASLEAQERRALCWVAAGAGPLESRLRREAAEAQVPLYLVGQLKAAERDALLLSAELFVLPSHRLGRRVEGSPVALMEALSMGCAVIASRAGGVEALLSEAPAELRQDLELCSPAAVEELKERLSQRISDWRALRPEARQRRREELSRWGARWRWSGLGAAHRRALEEAISLSSSRPSRP